MPAPAWGPGMGRETPTPSHCVHSEPPSCPPRLPPAQPVCQSLEGAGVSCLPYLFPDVSLPCLRGDLPLTLGPIYWPLIARGYQLCRERSFLPPLPCCRTWRVTGDHELRCLPGSQPAPGSCQHSASQGPPSASPSPCAAQPCHLWEAWAGPREAPHPPPPVTPRAGGPEPGRNGKTGFLGPRGCRRPRPSPFCRRHRGPQTAFSVLLFVFVHFIRKDCKIAT